MSEAGERPAGEPATPPDPARTWTTPILRGGLVFVLVAGVGQIFATAVWVVGGTGASFLDAVRIGWIYFGAFHHVAIELDVPELEVGAGTAASAGATSLSIGVALLAVTAVAAWLLFRAGRDVAERAGGGPARRLLVGAAIGPGYALPAFALSLLVQVRTPVRLGAFASGELHIALSPWQALVFPLLLATVVGAAGGIRCALDGPGERRIGLAGAAASGGVRMLAVSLPLSLGGLFVAGVVQPDAPVALLTPSTARYLRAVFDRPALGLVALGHHVAIAPNEALWTLVPAMGGCDGVRGTEEADFLCYRRFPTAVGTTARPLTERTQVRVPLGGAVFGTAPVPYFLFLLVPAVASVAGGRRSAARRGGSARDRIGAGGAAGVVFAALAATGALASSVTIGYVAAFGGEGSAGWLMIGPHPGQAGMWALAWGVAGGVLGAATVGRPLTRRRAPSP